MKRVVEVERYVEVELEVWTPRPRRTSRDSSVVTQYQYFNSENDSVWRSSAMPRAAEVSLQADTRDR